MKQKLLIFFLFMSSILMAQDTIVMSLQDAMQLATEQSLEAFRAKNMYLKSYWDYRSYKAGLLPNVDLNLSPISYVRALTKRYDYDQNIDIYREQRSFENSGVLSISQNIGFSGGQIYVSSELSKLNNFGDPSSTNYSATPIRMGFKQPILGYNNFKWQSKIAPMEFEMAKKQFIMDLQSVKLDIVDLYFNLLLEYKRLSIAQNNLDNAKKLYEIGKQKYAILTIRKEQLLDLELDIFNSQIELSRQNLNLNKAILSLNSYLNLDTNLIIKPVLPELNDTLNIKPAKALEYAKKNNPDFLSNNIQRVQADADLDKSIKESRFNANLQASFGLNQQADNLPDAYKNPLNQEVVLFTVQIPLIDWGKAKGQRQMAKMDREITYIDTKQKENDLQQNIVLDVLTFNLQNKIVQSAQKAKQIANESYELTQKSFLIGQADVLDINTAKTNRQSAEENYIANVYSFWKYYYQIQQITLYDFINNSEISEDKFFKDVK